MSRRSPLLLSLTFILIGAPAHAANLPGRISALFLGDRGHHHPSDRYAQLLPMFPWRGTDVTYTSDVRDLNPQTLSGYDALILYANIDRVTDDQAAACFRNNAEIVAMIGGQFKRHGTGEFTTTITAADHEVMRGVKPLRSWDETYEHTLHNEAGRTVLEARVGEPYTWVRSEGNGRVFYTAWGHGARTWSRPEFLDGVERGVRWAASEDVQGGAGVHAAGQPRRHIRTPLHRAEGPRRVPLHLHLPGALADHAGRARR